MKPSTKDTLLFWFIVVMLAAGAALFALMTYELWLTHWVLGVLWICGGIWAVWPPKKT